jgi:hypothetical protein
VIEGERIKLLRQLSEALPEELCGAYFDPSYGGLRESVDVPFVNFYHDEDRSRHRLYLLGEEEADAWVTMRLLRAMSEEGFIWTLRTALSEDSGPWGEATYGEYTWRPGWYELWLVYKKADGTQHGCGQEYYGETMAEAVAKAFVGVFKK